MLVALKKIPDLQIWYIGELFQCAFKLLHGMEMLQKKMHSTKRVKGTLTYLILLVRRQYEHMRPCKSGGSRDINSMSTNGLLSRKR